MTLEDSTTYQYLIRKGTQQGTEMGIQSVRRIILHNGTKRFGDPSKDKFNQLQNTSDLNRLEKIAESVLDVKSWDELLGE